MRRMMIGIVLVLVPLVGITVAQEAEMPATVVVAPADVAWGDPPPVLEKGSSFAVISGDPSGPGTFVVRLKMPEGYKVKPHWHPTDEHVTVLSGTFAFGVGDTFDESKMTKLPQGGFISLHAETRHYAKAVTESTIQIQGPGPFVLNYVNPDDDPRKKAAAQ